MSGQGFKNRKKFVRDAKKAGGKDPLIAHCGKCGSLVDMLTHKCGPKIRTDWPHLEKGQYVYYVKNRTTGEYKEVVAVDRFEAESKAFPTKNINHELRSMSIRSWKEQK